MVIATAVRHARRRQAGVIGVLLRLPAVDRVDVERRGSRAFGDHGHFRALAGQKRKQARLHLGQDGAHVAHGAIAQKRHGAMGDPALGLDLGPPDAAMAEADTVLVERFWDDDVLHAVRVEIPLLGEVGDAAIAARFLVGRGADLDRAGETGMGVDEGFGGDDGGRDAAFHVAGAAAIDAAIPDLTAEGIGGPAMSGFHDVVMAVEMHAVAGRGPLDSRDHVPAGDSGRCRRARHGRGSSRRKKPRFSSRAPR